MITARIRVAKAFNYIAENSKYAISNVEPDAALTSAILALELALFKTDPVLHVL